MYAILDYVLFIFNKIVNILNTQFFPDVKITFLEVILVAIILKYIIKFITGGFNEMESVSNYGNSMLVSKSMDNVQRKYNLSQEKKADEKIIKNVWNAGYEGLANRLRFEYFYKYGHFPGKKKGKL